MGKKETEKREWIGLASEIEGKSKGDVLEAKCFKKERSTRLNTTDRSNEMRTENSLTLFPSGTQSHVNIFCSEWVTHTTRFNLY